MSIGETHFPGQYHVLNLVVSTTDHKEKKDEEKVMKKMVKRTVLMIMAVMMLLPATPAMAASKKTLRKRAIKTYATYLASHEAPRISERNYYDASYQPSNINYVSYFTTFDLNRDKVPELFALTSINHRYFIVKIYTYKKGKMQLYKYSDGQDAVLYDYCGASGHYFIMICKKGHIHNTWEGSTPFGFETDQTVYKNVKGKLKQYLRKSGSSYMKYGKSITASKYTSLTKGCKEKTDIKYGNTSANRNLLKKGKIK